MSYLKFEKSELVNLEYALSRELIRANRAGSYASTTIIGCNTRKYHGLLVCPLEELDGEHHVLLSTLDATVIQHEKEFNLGIHKYEGDNYLPKGHKYVRDFDANKGSKLIYRIGGVVLSREILMVSKSEQVLVKYTLEEGSSDTLLRLTPYLAFRNFHLLSKSNLYANTRYEEVRQGIVSCLYEGYPGLYLQCSKEAEFVPVPDWYYNIEYMEEQKRGYEYKEDLYVPGYFELPIKQGESVIFSAATFEAAPGGLKRRFSSEQQARIPRDSFRSCLVNSAQQFIVNKKGSTEVIAGFPWQGSWSRDTFMALPGLCLSLGEVQTARKVLDSMLKRLEGGFFPNRIESGQAVYNSADAPLWFIWALQQLEQADPRTPTWEKYGKAIKSILKAYREGSSDLVHMTEQGLIRIQHQDLPLTWMDGMVDGKAVTPRDGMPVEINALWYNALCQALAWAKGKDEAFVAHWKDVPEQVASAFCAHFWDEEKAYLADVVSDEGKDLSVRPNQVLAAALTFSPLSLEMKKGILDVLESELLTPRGLRTLSPKNMAYKETYEGPPGTRALAYHQGTVWPWLLEHFVKAYLEVYKKSGVGKLKRLYDGFEDAMSVRGIGSISEVYDGNPPHVARGAVSQATGVAALLRIGDMLESFNTEDL